MVVDHLPGGKFWEPNADTFPQTSSVMKHNKLPEFTFDQLDQLLRYRPNATLLPNEVFIMYSHNKTRDWLKNLEEKMRNELIDESVKQGKELRKVFRERLAQIEQQRIERQRKRQETLEESQ